jgi:hypothetical protein
LLFACPRFFLTGDDVPRVASLLVHGPQGLPLKFETNV